MTAERILHGRLGGGQTGTEQEGPGCVELGLRCRAEEPGAVISPPPIKLALPAGLSVGGRSRFSIRRVPVRGSALPPPRHSPSSSRPEFPL